MTLPPDSRPARPQTETVSVAEAGPLFFALFADPQPPQLTQLIKEYFVYEDFRDHGFFEEKATTQTLSPNSPHIQPISVGNASEIITITIIHHCLGYGPQTDLLIAKKDETITPYSYPKRSEKSVEPRPLTTWDKNIKELVNYQPDNRWGDGARIERWQQDVDNNCYQLRGQLALKGISLIHLLTQLRT